MHTQDTQLVKDLRKVGDMALAALVIAAQAAAFFAVVRYLAS